MPNCTKKIDPKTIEFSPQGRHVVEGRFDGGSMTSDAGVMLLSETDRRIGLTQASARCIPDPRSPLLITHAVRDMLRQRVYGLALGWEDLSDHGALRQDVAMQTAVGVGRNVASAPTSPVRGHQHRPSSHPTPMFGTTLVRQRRLLAPYLSFASCLL